MTLTEKTEKIQTAIELICALCFLVPLIYAMWALSQIQR